MAKNTYVVAEGMSFTAMGHIFVAGEVIPESAFSERGYLSKMISEKKIIEKGNFEKPVEASVKDTVEGKAENPVENTGTKKSTAKGGK